MRPYLYLPPSLDKRFVLNNTTLLSFPFFKSHYSTGGQKPKSSRKEVFICFQLYLLVVYIVIFRCRGIRSEGPIFHWRAATVPSKCGSKRIKKSKLS